MRHLKPSIQSLICGMFCLSVFSLYADTTQGSSKPYSAKPALQTPVKKAEPPPQYKPQPKQELPPMTKPFGMPGVIGLQGNQWQGTDYLGYLSNNIGIDVEILKADNVPDVTDTNSIQSLISGVFYKENIIPRAEATEGPPLPFFHLLFIIYPVDRDRYVIFGNARLFEQIQVIRKDFIPAGYWQGITWETQDIAISNGAQLNAKLKELADKLSTSFAKRYRQYNVSTEGIQGATQNNYLPPAPAEAAPTMQHQPPQ